MQLEMVFTGTTTQVAFPFASRTGAAWRGASVMADGKVFAGGLGLAGVELNQNLDQLKEGIDWSLVSDLRLVRFEEAPTNPETGELLPDPVYLELLKLKQGTVIKAVLSLIMRIANDTKVPAFRVVELEVIRQPAASGRVFVAPDAKKP